MNTSFTNGPFSLNMSKATELTRAGKLTEATALIQSMLASNAPDTAQSAPQPAPQTTTILPADDVIEGEFTRIDTPDDAPPSTRQADAPRSGFGKPAFRQPRSRLGETLRNLKSMKMPGLSATTGAEPTIPTGAAFLSLSHGSGPSKISYRLYVPARKTKEPMPLIVMLHGCTQSPEDFATGTGMNRLAEEFGCLVAYPAQEQSANAQKCWNWFRPQDQGRGGEPARIAGLTQDILRDHPVDPARIYIAGLSAGGAAAVLVAAAYPEIFSAVGVHSGLPAGAAQDIPSAFAAMRSGAAGNPRSVPMPTIVFHGTADNTVHQRNGTAVIDQVVAAMPGLSKTHSQSVSSGGRQVKRSCHTEAGGRIMAEHWEIAGAGHAWAGGQTGGSYVDPTGPDASREMLRFFLQT